MENLNLMSPGAIAATNLMFLSSPQSASRKSKQSDRMAAPNAMTCKRRIDFTNSYSYEGLQFVDSQLRSKHPTTKLQTPSVERRNERERNRVRLVNMGFTTLRDHVPLVHKNKKLSKVDTLKAACDYIKHLQELLDETDSQYSDAAPRNNSSSMSPSGSSGSAEDSSNSSEGYLSDSSYSCVDSAYPDSLEPEERDELTVDFNLFM